MKLEVGKKYVCRNAPTVKYVRVDAIRPEAELKDTRVAATQFCINGEVHTTECTIGGRFYSDTVEHPDDLVAEYVEKPFVVDKCGVYKTRSGKQAKVVSVPLGDMWPVIIVLSPECMYPGYSTYISGRLSNTHDNPLDIIEYVRPFTQEDFV